MLSNLASYLGYSSAPVERTPPATITADVRLREEEDDWVLVEADEREGTAVNGAAPDLDEDSGLTRVTLAISTCPASLPGSSKSLSRSVSLDVCPLQESWYLTPPPSFTSDGPVHMETSPLENMLIEHPSMSVYEHTSRRNSSITGPSLQEESPSSLRPSSPTRLPRKEKLNKVPRNKVNTKFSKKLTGKRASDEGDHAETTEGKTTETKEPKMKNFVKSPRRSINAAQSQRVPNISRSEPFEEITSRDENNIVEVQVVPTRKLYSEVLASKPEPTSEEKPAVEPVVEVKEQEVPETALGESEEVIAECENAMSIEEDSPAVEPEEERAEAESDRRRAVVQTIADHQQRQNFLTRSAQKVEQRKTCDLIKRNPLIRTNKAREINFRNKRQRRADMMQRHSGANNNRKC